MFSQNLCKEKKNRKKNNKKGEKKASHPAYDNASVLALTAISNRLESFSLNAK